MVPRCLRAATLLAATALFPCPTVLAQDNREGNVPVPGARVDHTLIGLLNRRPAAGMDDAELSGFAKGSRIEILTWERAYSLALVGHRATRQSREMSLVDALDPEDLTVRAARHGVADFARFRKDFFEGIAGPGKADMTFRDPSGDYFDLLRRIQAVDDARWDVSSIEGLLSVVRQLQLAAASAPNDADINRLDIALLAGPPQDVGRDDEVSRRARRIQDRSGPLTARPRRHRPGEPRGVPLGLRGGPSLVHGSASVHCGLASSGRSTPGAGELVIGGKSFLGVLGEAPDPLEHLLSLGARVAREPGRRGRGPGCRGSRRLARTAGATPDPASSPDVPGLRGRKAEVSFSPSVLKIRRSSESSRPPWHRRARTVKPWW